MRTRPGKAVMKRLVCHCSRVLPTLGLVVGLGLVGLGLLGGVVVGGVGGHVGVLPAKLVSGLDHHAAIALLPLHEEVAAGQPALRGHRRHVAEVKRLGIIERYIMQQQA